MANFDNCCLSNKKISTIVCTIILIVYELYSLYDNLSNIRGPNENTDILEKELDIHVAYYYIGLAFNVILVCTLIYLIIGIDQNKLYLMNCFRIIYAVYLVCLVGGIVYYTMVINKLVKKLSSDEQELQLFCSKYFKGKTSTNLEKECQNYKNNLDTTRVYSIIFLIIPGIIQLFYYLIIWSYIRSVEKDEKEVEEIKDIESATSTN